MMRTMPRESARVNHVDQSRDAELSQAQELLFFAFRRITAEPDRLLARHGFGRVHHRVLHFVGRNAGLSVGDLLRILGVSKQALNRPLRQLVEGGWIETAPSPTSGRVKVLRLSTRGARLEARLSGDQRARFARVFAAVGPRAEAAWREVMAQLAR